MTDDTDWDENVRGMRMADPKGTTIFKYPIPMLTDFVLDLPEHARVLRVDAVDGHCWMWVLHDLERPRIPRRFAMYKTGGDIGISMSYLMYVGFVTIHVQQELCLYVFEVI